MCDHAAMVRGHGIVDREGRCDASPSLVVRAGKLIAGVLLVGTVLAVLALGTCVASSRPEYYVQYVPDDAFYYFVLARNFAQQGLWTFDSGTSTTTGFHPLHAYMLAGIWQCFRLGEDAFVRAGMCISLGGACLLYIVGVCMLLRRPHPVPVLCFCALVLSRVTLLNSISAVEWSWVVILASGYAAIFIACGQNTRRAQSALFAIGLLGSLARTDFGLFPAGLAAASIGSFLLNRDRHRLVAAMTGVMGAGCGVLLVMLHNYCIAGTVLQSSALMKLHWLGEHGFSAARVQGVIFRMFGPASVVVRTLVRLVVALALAVGTWQFALRHSSSPPMPSDEKTACHHDARFGVMWWGSLLSLVSYGAFYARNPALQHWYSANLIVPVFMFISLPFVRTASATVGWATAALLLMLFGIQVRDAHNFLRVPEWPHQQHKYTAGRFLRTADLEGRIGSWNAGIVGYYQGGTVVNLDGLVNNDVVGYARANQLPRYIDEKDIRWLVDSRNMLELVHYRRRGGYDDPAFLDRLVIEKRFCGPMPGYHDRLLIRILPAAGCRASGNALSVSRQ